MKSVIERQTEKGNYLGDWHKPGNQSIEQLSKTMFMQGECM